MKIKSEMCMWCMMYDVCSSWSVLSSMKTWRTSSSEIQLSALFMTARTWRGQGVHVICWVLLCASIFWRTPGWTKYDQDLAVQSDKPSFHAFGISHMLSLTSLCCKVRSGGPSWWTDASELDGQRFSVLHQDAAAGLRSPRKRTDP